VTGARNGRTVLLLIAGIPLTMILAASWLWFFVARGDLDLVGALGTSNRGELVEPPRQLDDAVLVNAAGAPLRYADLEPRWSLLIPGGNTCGRACEHSLYLTRQIHIAIGKDFNRLRRVHVSTAPPGAIDLAVATLSDGGAAPADFQSLLAAEHAGTRALHLAARDFDGLFPEWHTNRSTWYLVDPRGWIMMSYNSDVAYKDAIADLKFLLKNSSG